MSSRTLYATAIVASALLLAAIPALPATATTTTTTNLSVPNVPYVAFTNGTYQVSETAITSATSTLTFTLPVGAWQGRGITTASYQISAAGPTLSGTAQITANKVTIPLPAGFTTNTPAGPNGYVVQVSGSAGLPPSVPHPVGELSANCLGAPGFAYSLNLGILVPFSATPGASDATTSLTPANAVPHSGTGSDRCYWVAPATPLSIEPGDSFTYSATAALFSGAWIARVGFGGGGEGPAPVDLTTSANGSSLTATVPSKADLSAYSDPQLTPNLGLFNDSNSTDRVYIGTPVHPKTWAPTVTRIAGSDRFDTSVALSRSGFPSTAPVVVLATGMNYPDALAAGPAAARLGGPLLLTAPTSLPASVAAEIKRLEPAKIVIVGGQSAISSSVEKQLKELAPAVTRIAGEDRFDTARRIVTYAFPSATTAYVATAMNYPDALSAAAAAGSRNAPVLLVNGIAGTLDLPSATLLTSLGVTSATVVGGANAVSSGIESGLRTQLGTSHVTRLAGDDRFATSVLVAQNAFTSSAMAYVATGLQFPDALAGSALAAAKHAPLLTSLQTCLPAATKAQLRTLGVSTVTLIGGINALSDRVAKLTVC